MKDEVVQPGPLSGEQKVDALRETIRSMAAALESGAWPDTLSADEDVARLEGAVRAALAHCQPLGAIPERHKAKELYKGRASFDFAAKGVFQTDGFSVTVDGHTIAETEDSEVADWICKAWNTPPGAQPEAKPLGDGGALPPRPKGSFYSKKYLPTSALMFADEADRYMDVLESAIATITKERDLERVEVKLLWSAFEDLTASVTKWRKRAEAAERERDDALQQLAKDDAGIVVPVDSGAEMIAAERWRQVSVEGWTAEHDVMHSRGQLQSAAADYLAEAKRVMRKHEPLTDERGLPLGWPWEAAWWKPSPDPIRNLVKAGALIAAEIDRLRFLTPTQADQPADAEKA